MGAGYGHALVFVHEIGQHITSVDYRYLSFFGFHQFRVVRMDGGRNHHHFRPFNLAGRMADENQGPFFGQVGGHVARFGI